MPYVVLCSGLEYPAKMEEKLSQHDFASYTAERHQLLCWQASICVDWAVCKVLACLLGSWFASFGTEFLIAAIIPIFQDAQLQLDESLRANDDLKENFAIVERRNRI